MLSLSLYSYRYRYRVARERLKDLSLYCTVSLAIEPGVGYDITFFHTAVRDNEKQSIVSHKQMTNNSPLWPHWWPFLTGFFSIRDVMDDGGIPAVVNWPLFSWLFACCRSYLFLSGRNQMPTGELLLKFNFEKGLKPIFVLIPLYWLFFFCLSTHIPGVIRPLEAT